MATSRRFRAIWAAAVVVTLTPLVVANAQPLSASYTPLGNPHHYTLTTALDGSDNKTVVVRWDPCTAITYRVNARGGGAGALREARQAVAKIEAASGLRLHYLGTTDYIPSGKSEKGLFGLPTIAFDPVAQRAATGADLVIAWAKPGRGAGASRLLSSTGEDGVGGYYDQWTTVSRLRITSGFAIIRDDVALKPGFGRGLTVGHFLLHELGHAVGLDHYNDGVQQMTAIWNAANSSPAQYNAGDIAGLRRVGRAAGCIKP